MKKIRKVNNYIIYEVTARDASKGIPTDCKYLLINKDEAEFPESMREIEWMSDSVQELIDFVNPSFNFTGFNNRSNRGLLS